MTRAFVVLALLASTAQADVPDDAEVACRSKSQGAACEEGACVMSTCSRSRPGPDGNVQTSTWDCMRCVTGAEVSGGGLRVGIGIGVAVMIIAGGIWLARKRMKAKAE